MEYGKIFFYILWEAYRYKKEEAIITRNEEQQKPLTVGGVLESISRLKNNTAPGIDSITGAKELTGLLIFYIA